jgi:hypothetical protein
LTEPGFGSDAGGAQTRAVLDRRRRRVGHQRQQGIHHQLRHRHHLARGGGGGDRPVGRRPQGTLDHPGAVRHARLHRPTWILQGRAGVPPTPTSSPSTTCGCRRRTCSARGVAASRSSCRRSTRAGSRSRRWRPGCRRAASTSRCGTPGSGGLRPPDLVVPGDPVQDRGHGGARPHVPARLARRRLPAGAGAGDQAGGRDRQAARQRGGGDQRPRGDADPLAATGS